MGIGTSISVNGGVVVVVCAVCGCEQGLHLGSCSVLKLGVDRNVDLDKEGLL